MIISIIEADLEMTMETAFTPLPAFAGGIMIGLAAVLLLVADGRIAGISGIMGGLFAPAKGDFAWRLAFIVGLPAGAWTAVAVLGETPAVTMPASGATAVLAGLLVGYRLSPRSLAATATFLGMAMITVFVVRHLLGA